MAWDTGPATVIGPHNGTSFWQPPPTGGHVTIKVAPPHFPSNFYAVGTQTVPPGGRLPVHAHQRAEELLFVLSGTAMATIDGVSHRLERGALLYAGRWVEHGIVNDGDTDLVLYFVLWPPGSTSLSPTSVNFGRPATRTQSTGHRLTTFRPDWHQPIS